MYYCHVILPLVTYRLVVPFPVGLALLAHY